MMGEDNPIKDTKTVLDLDLVEPQEFVLSPDAKLTELSELIAKTPSLSTEFTWIDSRDDSEEKAQSHVFKVEFNVVPSINPKVEEQYSSQIASLVSKLNPGMDFLAENIQKLDWISNPYLKDNFDQIAKDVNMDEGSGHQIRRDWESKVILEAIKNGLVENEKEGRELLSKNKFSGNRINGVTAALEILFKYSSLPQESKEAINNCKGEILEIFDNQKSGNNSTPNYNSATAEQKMIIMDGITAKVSRLLDNIAPVTEKK